MEPVLQKGDKILAVHRRLYENDMPRFFVGTVDAYDAGVARVTGHSWARDVVEGGVLSKPEPRTKVLAIASGSLMVYQLPANTDVEGARFEVDREGRLWLVDGKSLKLDLRERP